MGLDTVELIMEVEETFDITISDRDAEKLRTPGAIHCYVMERLELEEQALPSCPTSAAFYRFRRLLMRELGVPRKAVRPDVALDSLVPRAGRRAAWDQLNQATVLELPRLRQPKWTIALVFALQFFTSLALLLVQPIQTAEMYSAWAVVHALVLIPLYLLFAHAATRPLAVNFPRRCQTVRGLVDSAAMLTYGRTDTRGKRWQNDEAWVTIRELVSATYGVDPSVIKPDSDIMRDFF